MRIENITIISLCIIIGYLVYLLYQSNQTLNKTEIIKKLLRQSSRWGVASAQDQNAMIAVLHANYGAGYLWALKDISSSEEIEDATGINLLRFEDEVTRIQDNATTRMAKLCPDYAPEPSYLTRIAGEGI